MRTRWTSSTLLFSSLVLWIVVAFPGSFGQAAGDTLLVTAVRQGDLAAVRALIAKRADVNEPGADGSTPLLWAVYQSDPDSVNALLAAGAAVNTPNRYGVTPLLQACRTGDVPIVRALLDGGADPSRTHTDVETPLMAASRSGSVEAVRLLLARGVEVNAADAFERQTALMWAAGEGHTDIVALLLEAGANPDVRAHVTTLEERKHADHPTGGFTALMFAARNGHEEAVRTLVGGGANPNVTNGDGASATIVAIVNDRFDLAKTLIDLGADPNDGSLYFAVDMHDATTDMRARDGSRLRADHPNTLNALDLVKLLLARGADPNKPFVGQLHSTTLCCGEEINSSPFFRAAIAADVDALRLMLAHGAQVDWSPSEVKREGRETPAGGGGRGMNANVGRTPIMVAMTGGRGAPFAAGPGFERLGPPPFREEAVRNPLEAVQALLAAGANPNVTAPDGSTPLHQAVQARQVPIVRALVGAGAKLDAVNKDNLTPLQLAEKPEPPPPPGNNSDSRVWRPARNTRGEVIAALRELMGLGPNDPTPVPPPVAKPAPADGESTNKAPEPDAPAKPEQPKVEGR
jgi:ankyrin repeat protein